MDNQLKSNGKGVSWRHSVWIFFKAQISAQFASFVDFLVTILLVKAFAVFYLYATFTGSVVGGIVNCAINYGWVFHAEDCKKTHVAVKYLFVWGGSICHAAHADHVDDLIPAAEQFADIFIHTGVTPPLPRRG